ncbi:MAG: hypothetical protein HKN11_21375 [Rhizobiales bacterium]|nr:hypothetical protein [Hyphomicrobiales bacterium]
MAGVNNAAAAERVALIIGNSSYQKAAELKNPRNDAEEIARLLTKFGFRVLKGIDVDQFNFRILVRAFTREIKDAKLALFYYAGHGLQVGQRNFLLPVDAELKEEADLDFEAVKLGFILQQMERGKRTNIILMDACRDNPFAANLARNMGTRSSSIGRGLAPLETGVGTFVGFATQPGNVALDGQSNNSPFTKAIIKHMAEPGLDIGVMMRRVREEVIAETNGKQVPWSNSSLVGDSVVLNQAPRQIVVEPKAPQTTPSASLSNSTSSSSTSSTTAGSGTNPASSSADVALELSYWNTIKDSNSPTLLESYIAQYPNGTFVGLARAMISALSDGKTPKEPPKQQLAAVNPDQGAITQEVVKEPLDMRALSSELQGELRRVGCIAARPDGIWGRKSRAALKRYGRHAGRQLASLEPTQEILDHLKSTSQRVCPIVCGAKYNLKGGKCVRKTCARGQLLTRKGNCIAKAKPKKRKRRRREVVEEEFVEEEFREPRRRRKRNMFDDEGTLCPQCDTL